MLGRTHVVLGASFGALCTAAVHPWVPAGAAVLCMPIAALAAPGPDVDHHNAPARAITAPAVAVLVVLGWLYRGGCWVLRCDPHLYWATREFFRHRNGTHRIRTAFGFGGVIAALCYLSGVELLQAAGWVFGAAASAGWLSHIYGDARTLSGVPVGDTIVNVGTSVRTGSRCKGCQTRAARRRGRRVRSQPHDRHTEQHLLIYRFQPAAVVLCLGALILVAPTP